MSHRVCWLAMGSNLDAPVRQLQQAYRSLQQLDAIEIKGCSALYESPPLDGADQPNYVNAVVQFESTEDPLALLDSFLQIENQQGRVRKEHWGPRIIDLDLLLCGDEVVDSDRLSLPHKGLLVRAFVLYPMADIAPQWVLPNGKTVAKQLELLPRPMRLEEQLGNRVIQ